LISAGAAPWVVLRRDEHVRVRALHGGAPGFGVVAVVMLQAGMLGLVEERQVDLLQVDQFDRELPVRTGASDEPFSDGTTRPALPRAGDDDVKLHPVL
jgi:hypothetical protein